MVGNGRPTVSRGGRSLVVRRAESAIGCFKSTTESVIGEEEEMFLFRLFDHELPLDTTLRSTTRTT